MQRVLLNMIGVGLLAASAAAGAGEGPAPLDPAVSIGAHDHCTLHNEAMHLDAERVAPPVPQAALEQGKALLEAAEKSLTKANCDTASWAALSQSAMIAQVESTDYECLRPLFTFDAHVEQVISPANVAAVRAEIAALTGDAAGNAAALYQLLVYVQIAWFHDFYQAAIDYTDQLEDEMQQALAALAQQPGFLDAGTPAARLRMQWTTSIDSCNGQIDALGAIQSLLERWSAEPALHGVYEEQLSVYNLLFGLRRQIANNAGQGVNSPWYNGTAADLVEAIGVIATSTDYTAGIEYIVNNAIWLLGHMTHVNPAAMAQAHDYLSDAYALHPEDSARYVWTLNALDTFFNGELADGAVLDIAALKQEIEAMLFPNTYEYDGGRLSFRTGLGQDKIDDLYDALQEVEGQFFRLIGKVAPVAGDPNEHLTMIVYGSPAQYQTYQSFLYNLSTNNGGIYIEQDGTFYTYDRTPQESAYTLEELTRHEYVHYLDARYNVTGFFGGANTLYVQTKFTWYVEGLAEYLAGSTRRHGVLPRETHGHLIADDGGYMTPAEVTQAGYSSGFRFYQYAGTLMLYLRMHHTLLFLDLIAAVIADDEVALQTHFDTVASDAAVAAGYAAFLDGMVADYEGSTGLFFEDIGTAYRPALIPGQNEAALEAALYAGNSDYNRSVTLTPDRFVYAGSLQASAFLGIPVLYFGIQAMLDQRLAALENELPNFEAATAWYGNLHGIGGGQYEFDVYIEGPYNPNDTSVLFHAADQDLDGAISLSELLRVIQFFNAGSYHCDAATEDGFAPGAGMLACTAHASDYNPQDWSIALSELLRVIQFYNVGGYHADPAGEDGFAPGAP